ncbi:Calcineurin-like phosphoesterase [Phytophthora megakarya]|uniref:Calcineurin-like phosphoesterase n=1 Tax=Phytophthora megakarya TaxID=4795 RepID=A0A225VF92_9STRA|nr:Calcineurin-like phosphoesterase [Phytophthora megakarya]
MYPDTQGRGGIAEFAALLERERAAISPVATLLVTLNGDFMSGSQIGARTKGAHMIELMNHLDIDYVVLGNHEFDFGLPVLNERMKESKFKWLGSNVLDRTTKEPINGLVDTEVIELATGFKLGIFGVCCQETPQISNPGNEVVFDDIFKTSKRCVNQLLADGADFIVALTHLTIEQDKELARQVKSINVILGGHDHEPFTLFEGNTMIHKSGQNAFWLGKLEFVLSKTDPSKPVEVSSQWSMIANQSISPQPACERIVSKYMKLLEDEHAEASSRVLGILGLPLSTKSSLLRTGECNMGNLVADAIRGELNADIGVINGGFIRGNKIYDARTNITLGMVREEMPFPLKIVLIRIKAKHLRNALNQHLSKYPNPSGSFPHVSGLQLTVDVKAQPSQITSVKNEIGVELESETEMFVATTQFIFNGGDGCSAWQNGEIVRVGDEITIHVADYLMKKRLIMYPENEGRVKLVG